MNESNRSARIEAEMKAKIGEEGVNPRLAPFIYPTHIAYNTKLCINLTLSQNCTMKFSIAAAAVAATSSFVGVHASSSSSSVRGEGGANEKQSSNEVSASTSSTPGRQLGGKSGKATKASFPASPEDYDWIVGKYDPAGIPASLGLDISYNQVRLEYGEPVDNPLGLYYPGQLEIIKPFGDIPSLVYQATLDFKFVDSEFEVRQVLEGVGSFHPAKVDHITFYADHKEIRSSPDEEWVPLGSPEYHEATTVECTMLPEYSHGETIVCEAFGQVVSTTDSGVAHAESISTTAWNKIE